MAITGDAILRREKNKTLKGKDFDEQIKRIEEDIRKLKIEFDIYFNGGSKKAPHQSRSSLEARLKRINGDRGLSYSNRFHFQSVMSRYTSFRELWRRRLRAKGEDLI